MLIQVAEHSADRAEPELAYLYPLFSREEIHLVEAAPDVIALANAPGETSLLLERNGLWRCSRASDPFTCSACDALRIPVVPRKNAKSLLVSCSKATGSSFEEA